MLKSFVGAVKTANIEALKITDAQLKQVNAELDKTNFDKYPVDIWIAKDTKMISQFALKFAEDEGAFDFRLTMDSYNKPVKVEKPADAKSLLEIMGGFMGGGSFSGSSEATFDSELQSGISL
jgi:hypothetical protein